jgi:PAS domain S-box-containing protein
MDCSELSLKTKNQTLKERNLQAKDQLFAQWLVVVRKEIPAALGKSDEFLIDHLANFLDAVSSITDGSEDRSLYSEALKNAKLHGKQRSLDPDYTVSQVILEYTLLRETYFSLFDTQTNAMGTDYRLTVIRLFEAAVGSSTEEFVFEGKRRAGEQTENQLAVLLTEHTQFMRERERHLASRALENNEKTYELGSSSGQESRLRLIFAHAAVGFAVSNVAGEFIEVNPRFCEITGYSKEELLKLKIRQLLHPDDLERDEATLNKLLTEKNPNIVIEKRFQKPDGKVVWLRNSVSLVVGEKGEKLVIRVAEDVTTVRESERLRRESEERYILLANSMPQIVWTATSEGKLDYFNQVWFDYSGTTYDQNQGDGWVRAVYEKDLPGTLERWLYSVKTGETYENEFRLRDKDGSYRWHVARAVPARDLSGKIIKWYGTNTDIHQFKILTEELYEARRAVESERQKLQTIIADSYTSMAVLRGPDLVFEITNKSYHALFNDRALDGKSFVDALPELIGQEFPTHARQVLQTGVPYVDREAKAYLKRTADGPLEERYFDQTYTRMLDENGLPYGVFIHAREVTDLVFARRKVDESAERLRLAIENANIGTWEANPQTNLIRLSERTNELFGIKKTETLYLNTALERIHPEDRDRVTTAIAAAVDPAGSGDYEIDYRIVHDNDDIRWVSLLGKAFFTDSPTGKICSLFTGTVLDVTDRITTAATLREAKERAEMANAAKSSFLANMSHEIRTPLGAIMGFVSLMREEGIDQQTLLDYVAVIERNSTQLMRIIDDILDLSKVEAGMMLIENIQFSLIELLSDFSSLMGFRAREKGINFELKARTKLPDIIVSDPTRIRQVLTNIVGNAIKFTEWGSVHLYISYSNDMIEFEVEDSGRGITEEQTKNLFQPFSQADVSTTRKFGGTGLGLVLTRRLSEAMGGNFALKKSEPGKGSLFSATIRVQLVKVTQMVQALGFASEAIRSISPQAQLQGAKILLVEDSPDNQALFSIFLSRAGAKTEIVSDGNQGYERALHGDYDLVLMDVQMPIMDGITAVKKLRAQGYKKPVIALTAHAMKEERIRCLDAGYTDFLSKPVQRIDLIDMLVRYSNTKT